MIRPKWLAHATALQRRCLSSTRQVLNVERAESTTQDAKEKAPGMRAQDGDSSTSKSAKESPEDGNSEPYFPGEWWRKRPAKPTFRPKKLEEKNTITITGLSPSLSPSDFHRLVPQDLSAWSTTIEEVTQERDPWTLEPLDKWRLSFATAVAADAYVDKINRLHRLSQFKLHSANGLWTSVVPTHLRGDGNMEEEVQTFTLAPGSQKNLSISRNRRKSQWPWQRHVQMIVERSNFPTTGKIALLTLQRPCFNEDDLGTIISKGEKARNRPLGICNPYPLAASVNEVYLKLNEGTDRVPLFENIDFRQKLDSRFAVVCKDKDEAWRLMRYFNQTLLANLSTKTGHSEQTMVNVSLIE